MHVIKSLVTCLFFIRGVLIGLFKTNHSNLWTICPYLWVLITELHDISRLGIIPFKCVCQEQLLRLESNLQNIWKKKISSCRLNNKFDVKLVSQLCDFTAYVQLNEKDLTPLSHLSSLGIYYLWLCKLFFLLSLYSQDELVLERCFCK